MAAFRTKPRHAELRFEWVTYCADSVRVEVCSAWDPEHMGAERARVTFDGGQLKSLGGVFVPQHGHRFERCHAGRLNTYLVIAGENGNVYAPSEHGTGCITVRVALLDSRPAFDDFLDMGASE